MGAIPFVVRPTGRNFVRIELGHMRRDVSALEPSDAPDRLVLPVGVAVRGIEVLLGADCKCRLTGMEIGWLSLRYTGGKAQRVPLIVGGNVDCSRLPFATQVERRALRCDPSVESPTSVAAFTVPADARRVLREMEVHVFAADATLALLAVNLVENSPRAKARRNKRSLKRSG